MKRHSPVILILILCGACNVTPDFKRFSDAAQEIQDNASDKTKPLKITFLDVGQGDATLISASPVENVLIDAGPPESGRDIILPYLKQEGITKLKYIVATHYHTDHIAGIAEVAAGEDYVLGTADDFIPTAGFIDRGGTYEGNIYEEYESVSNGNRITAYPGDTYYVGEATVEVMAANGRFADGEEVPVGETFDENSASLALLVTQDDFKYLHASDITGGGGDPPYETADVETHLGELAGDVDVLRAAHHGSKTSSNESFLEAVSPEAVIISVGNNNEFGHPHDEVIERLIEAGADIYLTEQGWLDEEYLSDELIHIVDDEVIMEVIDGNWTIQ